MTLNRIWAGMLTKSEKHSDTSNRTVLIVNAGGKDLLHYTWPPTDQRDFGEGAANLYRVDVSGEGIDPNQFNDSSIRAGIRGENLWRPQHYVVWGVEGTKVIPLAAETEISVVLSTELSDPGPGHISLPLRPVVVGTAETKIRRILVMLRTGDSKYSGTPNDVTLRVVTTAGATVIDFDFPDTRQDERSRHNAGFFIVQATTSFSRNELDDNSVQLSIAGEDMWRPAQFFVFGVSSQNGRPEVVVPLVHEETWTQQPLSTNPSDSAGTGGSQQTAFLPLV